MTEEFKKARDVEAMDNFMYCNSPISDEAKAVYEENCRKFCKGADWAYKWISKSSEMLDSIEALEQKLAIAVEALNEIEMAVNIMARQHDEMTGNQYKEWEVERTIKQALTKIKGTKCDK